MPYKQVDIQTVGPAATVVNTAPIYGEIISISVVYDPLAAAGTDLVVLNIDMPLAGLPNNVFTFNNNNADGCFYPRCELVDINEIALDYDPLGPPITLQTDNMLSHGRLSVSIAQADPGVNVRNHTVYIIYKAEINQS